MIRLNSQRTARTNGNPPSETGDTPDAFLIDEEFDDFLDRERFAICESLADYRNC